MLKTIKVRRKIININKNSIKNKIVKYFGISTLIVILSAGVIASNVSRNYEDKINNFNKEKIKKAQSIVSIIRDEKMFKNYMDNYQYTDEMYKKDLLKIKEFDDFLLNGYKDYLERNKYRDERTNDEILNAIKKENSGEYFIIFRSFFYNDMIVSNNSMKKLMIYTKLYQWKNNKNISFIELIRINRDEKNIETKFYNYKNYIIKNSAINSMENYIKKNDLKENIMLFDRSIGRGKGNINNKKLIHKDYFDKIEKLEQNWNSFNSKKDDEILVIYNNKIYEVMHNEDTLKESLKLLNAAKSLSDNFIDLKESGNFKEGKIMFSEGMLINKLFFKSELTDFIFNQKDEYNGDFNFIFENDYVLKLELSGFNDWISSK